MRAVTRRATVSFFAFFAVAGLVVAQLVAADSAKAAGGSTVRVRITDAKVILGPATVKPGKVVFRIADTGTQPHAFAIGGKSTPMLRHGVTDVLTVSLAKAGSYKAVARTAAGKAFNAILAVGSAPQTILPSTPPTPTKTSTSTTPPASSACAQPVTATVTVTIVPPRFNFSRTTIPCGTVTFVVTNTGQLTHSLEITAPAGAPTIATQPPIQPGQTQTFTINMTAKGIYPWQCGEREDNADDGEYGNLLVQ
jgi:plastocyanin